MADDITIDYSLNPSGYLSGAQAVSQANTGLQQSFGSMLTTGTLASKAMDAITPKRASLAGFGLMAQAAANTEQSLSGLAATATVTGVNYGKLGATIHQLARDLPLGDKAARDTVTQFTQMGVAGEGTEKKIAALATTTLKLAGATGEGPAALADGMTNLARATGNTSLDPVRFTKLADSLTTVSAQSGASATNILSFSKNIAPMAQSAGIGATGVLGISSAFARLGEDGIGATTAVNKMLTDMSRAVREGGPELKTYAMITGQTVDNFAALAKAKPAEALTQVTEAIANAGTKGPRILEQLGLDGVRTMRSLQALSASGGLRSSIATATDAYGGGSTEKASQAAFGGLNDAVGKLTESASQLGEAFGDPLLGPLTTFVNGLKGGTDLLGTIANSDISQKLLSFGGALATAAIGAKVLSGPVSAILMGRQAATSGIARAAVGGLIGDATTGFKVRYGGTARDMAQAGTLAGTGMMGPMADRAYRFTSGVREGLGVGEGPSMMQRARGFVRGGWRYGNAAMTTFANQYGEQAFNARTPFQNRVSTWGTGDAGAAGGAAYAAARAGGETGPAAAAKGLNAFHTSVMTSEKGLGTFHGTLKALSNTTVQTNLALKDMSRAGVGAASTAARGPGVMSKIGSAVGPMAAITGGIMLAELGSSNAEKGKQATADYGNSDIRGELNAYRESIGKATSATQTVNSLSLDLSKTLAKNTTTFAEATTVTAADVKAAAGTKDKVTTSYVGSDPKGVAAQIAGISPSGMAPDELQAVKVDLLRQYSQSDVEGILKQLPASVKNNPTATVAAPGTDKAGITDMVNSLSGQGVNSGMAGAGSQLISGLFGVDAGTENYKAGGQFNISQRLFGSGGVFHESQLTDEQKGQAGALGKSIQTKYADQSQNYSSDYAEQERQKGQQTAIDAAMATGNKDLVAELAKSFSANTLGSKNALDITQGDIEAHHGSLAETMGAMNDTYGKQQKDLKGKQDAAGGELPPNIMQGATSKIIEAISPTMSKFLDARNTANPASQAVAASLAKPENAGLQSTAVDAMVASASKAGMSMTDLAKEASKTAGALAETSDEFKLMIAVIGKAQQTLSKQQQDMTPGGAFMSQYNFVRTQANQPKSDNPQVEATRQGYVQQQIDMEGQAKDRLRNRLQAQRQYEIQSARSTEEFNRQQLYAEQDHSLQVMRTKRNAYIQMARAQEDYQRSVTRATEDFALAQKNQIRDYNISIARSNEDFTVTRSRQTRDFNISTLREAQDFNVQRSRMIRDFNITLARNVEDAARSMYDPYTRIQTKATYDAKNLLSNLGEQNAAMVAQKKQLEQLRKMGLGGSSIDQLGLGKAENAQQVRNLVDDLSKDPSLVGKFNAAADARKIAAGALTQDDANIEYKRSNEDFAKSIADQDADRAKSLARSRQDLNKSFADQDADRKKNLTRAGQDLTKSLNDENLAFAKSLTRGNDDNSRSITRANDDLSRGLADMELDLSTSLGRQRISLNTQLGYMQTDLKNADLAIGGTFKELADGVYKAIHGQAISWEGLTKNDTLAFVVDMQTNVIPQVTGVGTQLGITLVGASPNNASSVVSDWHHSAEGGPVPGKSAHKRADNIHIMATAGEYVHPVDAVDYYGNAAMEAIRTRKVPRENLNGYANGGRVWPTNTRRLSPSYPGHSGVDIAASSGAPIYATEPGTITYAGYGHGYGQGIFEQFASGLSAVFGHTSKVIIAAGHVLAGQTIGLVGATGHATGPHLHFEVNSPGAFGTSANRATSLAYLNGSDVFTSGANGVIGGGSVDWNAIMSKMDQNRGGWYGMLRDSFKAKLIASGIGSGNQSGTSGASNANAQANQNIAAKLLGSYGWSNSEMPALIKLWNGESGWNERANNPSSGAYGIPQALPGSKMATVGADWRRNPETQIRWGLGYIKGRYGSPSATLSTWNARSPHWYDAGGVMAPGAGSHINATGKPEAVLTNEQWGGVAKLAERVGVLISAEDGKQLRAAAGGSLTINHQEHYTYDQRNDFAQAQITVRSEDPDELGRKLEAKATRQRLTARRA